MCANAQEAHPAAEAYNLQSHESPAPITAPSPASQDDAGEDIRRTNSYFHISMLLACLYLPMLLTNWGTEAYDGNASDYVGWPSVWIQMASQWTFVALYAWTLIAPTLFPHRKFV